MGADCSWLLGKGRSRRYGVTLSLTLRCRRLCRGGGSRVCGCQGILSFRTGSVPLLAAADLMLATAEFEENDMPVQLPLPMRVWPAYTTFIEKLTRQSQHLCN